MFIDFDIQERYFMQYIMMHKKKLLNENFSMVIRSCNLLVVTFQRCFLVDKHLVYRSVELK